MSVSKIGFMELPSNGTQAAILQAVRDSSPISRTGIVSLTGQPHAAVSRSVAVLLQNGIITESALSDTAGPRRKRGIRLNPEFGYCIAVEYGPEAIEGVVINTAYETLFTKTKKIHLAHLLPNDKIGHISAFVDELKAEVPVSIGRCLGLAAVDPGAIDRQAGVALMSTTMEHWHNVPVVKILESALNLPVMLLNTSVSKIRAIDRLELRGTSNNMIYIEYGEGIGCGLKLEGNYISGHSCLAGELGHVRFTDKSTVCACGGIGCLESVAALPALAARAKLALNKDSTSLLADIKDIDGLAVLKAAGKDDRLASHIVDEAFDYLGRAISGLINILNPEIILLDNSISVAGDEAVATLMRSINKNILSWHLKSLDVRISKLTSHIGALGGAAAVMDRCLEH